MASRRVQLLLLRGFELRDGDEVIDVGTSSRRVLAFLALHERQLTRSYVAGTLWPDSTEAKAGANLRTALWRLRRPGLEIVEVTSTHLRLSSEVFVDSRHLVVVAQQILERHGAVGPPELAPALAVEPHDLSGELLPDFWDAWLVIEREWLRQLGLHALECLAADLVELGQPGRAVLVALAAVEVEPLRESATRALVRAHLAHGNRIEAHRQVQRYGALLASELGLAPSRELMHLVEPVSARSGSG